MRYNPVVSVLRQILVKQCRILSRCLLIIEQEYPTGENHIPIKWGYPLLCIRQKATDRIKHGNTLMHPWYLVQKSEVGCSWHLCVATDPHACTRETKHNFEKTQSAAKACFFTRCPQIDEIRSQPAISSNLTRCTTKKIDSINPGMANLVKSMSIHLFVW